MTNRWGNSGNSDWLYFWGSKITVDGDCSHEIKRHLFLGKKVMTNLDSIFKSRDIALPTKVCLVKAMVFPVVMYGCESWTIKKAEHWRIDAFELWCGEDSWESLGLQGDPTSCIEGRRRRDDRGWDGWFASPTQWTWVWVNSGSWWWTGKPGMLQFMGSQRVGHDWATELNWTDRVSPSLGAKNMISLMLILTSWWCPFLDHLLSCWKRVFAIPSVFTWQNSVSLCSASVCTPRSIFPFIISISWFSTFAFQSLVMKRTSLFCVHSRRCCALP